MIRKINGCIIDCPFYSIDRGVYCCKLNAVLIPTILFNTPAEDCPLRKEALICMLSDEVKRKENNITEHDKSHCYFRIDKINLQKLKTMKFPKIYQAISIDDLRPAMNHVKIEKEFTFATDAHILVRHRTSEIFNEEFVLSLPDEGIMIPYNAIVLMCKKSTVKISLTKDKKYIELHQLDGSFMTYKCYDDSNYPDANSIIPDIKDCKPLEKIGINTSLLNRLSDAMGCSIPILHLHFFNPHKAILVTTPHSHYQFAIGIIMPTNIV
jgi:hypothetical protein